MAELSVLRDGRDAKKPTLVAAAVIASLVLAFAPSGWSGLAEVFTHSVYYFLWAAIGLLSLALAEDLAAPPVSLIGKLSHYRGPIALSGTLAAVTFFSVGTDFRVLADETNLIASSLSLHMDRTFRNITEAHHYYELMHVVTGKTPARPALFPFSMNILHSLLGYSAYHGFVINFLAAFATVLAVIRLGEKLVDRAFGYIAATLLMSFPLYSLVVTSSGFDALNLFLHTVIVLRLFCFLTHPTALQFEILLLVVLLGSQCRYETLVYLVPVAIAGGLHFKPILKTRISWRLVVVPFLFVPIVWQRLIHGTNFLQLMDGHSVPFSIAHLATNTANAYDFFTNRGGAEYPTSLVLVILLVVGASWLAFTLGKSAKASKNGPFNPILLLVGLTAVGLFIMAIVQFSYSMGDLTTPYNMRYGVVYLVGFVFLAAFPLYRVGQMKHGVVIVVVFLAANFIQHISVAAENRLGKTLTLPREYKRNLDFLKDYPRSGTLIVADRPGMYVAHEFAAVGFKYANKNARRILRNLERDLYRILVIQKINYKHRKTKTPLAAPFKTEVVHEYQNSGEYFIRISRVVL